MMIPASAAINLLHEPLLSAPQPYKVTVPARETVAVDSTEKEIEPTPSQEPMAMTEINQALQMAGVGVRFEFNQEAETMITKVVDVVSGEVIRQMPTEDVLRISKALGKLQGLLVDQKV